MRREHREKRFERRRYEENEEFEIDIISLRVLCISSQPSRFITFFT